MLFLSIALFAFLFSPLGASSSALPEVIINEVAWMGSNSSYNDEWLELYNNTDSKIILDGWILKTASEKIMISLQGEISPGEFYILERTDDDTLPEVIANQIYSGSLNNKGDVLELINKDGILIDRADFRDGWPAGDNKTKQTMEKTDFLSWQSSREPGGTPQEKNSQAKEAPDINSIAKEDLNPVAFQKNGQGLTVLPFTALMIALTLATMSSILIILIKRRLKEK